MFFLVLGLAGLASADMMYHLSPGPHQLVLLSPVGDLSSVLLFPSCEDGEGPDGGRVIHPNEEYLVDSSLATGDGNGALHLVPTEPMDSIYVFHLNFSFGECWRAKYSSTVKLAIVGSDDGLEVLGIVPPPPVEEDGGSVPGEAVGAVLVWCALPLLLAGVMAISTSEKLFPLPARLVLLLQGFGSGGLLAVVVLYLYPQMVTRLAISDAPQWMGGGVILGGVCALALAELVSGKLSATGGHLPVYSKLLGMTAHKLVEGVVICAAFVGCGTDAGWFVLGALVARALPQVAQDLGEMVSSSTDQWTLGKAALAQTASHLPALVGMGIVLGLGTMQGYQPALLLGFGIGAYLFIALSNVMPKLVLANAWDQWLFVGIGLTSGAVAVGASSMGSGNETCW